MGGALGRSISFGPFRLYPTARVIERDGARLALGSRALDILIVLADRAGEVVSLRTERGVAEAQRKLHDDQAFEPGTRAGR